eukprot:jgi/Ulvmu1/4321/UM002_0044.1
MQSIQSGIEYKLKRATEADHGKDHDPPTDTGEGAGERASVQQDFARAAQQGLQPCLKDIMSVTRCRSI